MAGPPALFLYAELLPNIRQLTLHVSLPSSPSGIDIRESTITLSESCRAVTVFTLHQGVELVETLKLPARVTDASRRNLSFAGHRVDIGATESKAQIVEYSFRLQVDPNENGLALRNQDIQEDDYVPWTANDLSTCISLHCRLCRQMILDTSSKPDLNTWQWKDLPSGNWAEMMDFWHCHKPDVHPDEKQGQKNIEEQNASVKGYGASNRVVATPRTGLVDVASFLVAESDCYNIKVLQPRPISASAKSTLHGGKDARNIRCSGCSAIIGTEDSVAEGLRLYKNNISVGRRDATEHAYETYSVDIITSAQLLDLIDHEGVRRFVIHAGQSDGILLWAFNPDLRYSSSSADHSIISRRAMKVLYQNVTDVEGILEPENGAPTSLSLEELFLPENIYNELVLSLQRTNLLIPVSARIFQTYVTIMISDNSLRRSTLDQWPSRMAVQVLQCYKGVHNGRGVLPYTTFSFAEIYIMASKCIHPLIQERPDLARETQECDPECTVEQYSSTYEGSYRKWASKQQFMSLVRSLNALDVPSAQHIEDIHDISADDMKPIFNLDQMKKTTSEVPELLISNSLSPSDNHLECTWGNADDIPTRVPSAALEEFPPLVRCRNDSAMGYLDDFTNDMDYEDSDSVSSDWSFYSHLNVDEDGLGRAMEGDPEDSSTSSCKEQSCRSTESKDNKSWAFILPASSPMQIQRPCRSTLHADEVSSKCLD
ncbi:conserved hypothetical protein [Talaromyces stipitatus ATCC 10500]|uniref:Ubiquitin-conjugating enzyme E2C-binding protein n=1 Tax=Talaromyces stipitatus (strain ATCC 10500 / CBS 375.48 / QM 6759 / NRRL 1006) TaxID=441959 RepID=B8MTH4_TALSN|nr:uncharacterized protein TSTA_003640 [Talaromyces stipitatus ATCC 10500]EED12306.1 conserved hypothetical protein [Talaromyces stipitatus ATCC 10500]